MPEPQPQPQQTRPSLPPAIHISAVLITCNERHNIEDCIDSLQWLDEILVVDSGSEDGTVQWCEQSGCRVVQQDWLGFGKQKALAVSLARHDWVLSIDADERVPLLLQQEILKCFTDRLNNADDTIAYQLPRRSWFCGKKIRFSGWYPDYTIRLFNRKHAQFNDAIVHERVLANGVTAKLREPLEHYSYRTLEDVLSKMNRYSTLSAQQMYLAGKRSSLPLAVGKGLWTFFRSYFLQLGFVDGAQGFMLAVSRAQGSYYKYLKLAWLSRKPREEA